MQRFFLVCIGVLIVAQVHAQAYTDPGSGTLILQMLLAASFGAMFYLRRIIGWVRNIGSERKAKASESASFRNDSDKESGAVE